MPGFEGWLAAHGLLRQLQPLRIIPAFEVMVARLDGARAAGATVPLRAVSTRLAGPNSRAATHRMLEQLGYNPPQRRIIHRLLAGSPSGWPGLLMLFATAADLSPGDRQYILRQARSFHLAAGEEPEGGEPHRVPRTG